MIKRKWWWQFVPIVCMIVLDSSHDEVGGHLLDNLQNFVSFCFMTELSKWDLWSYVQLVVTLSQGKWRVSIKKMTKSSYGGCLSYYKQVLVWEHGYKEGTLIKENNNNILRSGCWNDFWGDLTWMLHLIGRFLLVWWMYVNLLWNMKRIRIWC